MSKRVLIIGGTGVFGKRLARHLTAFHGIDVFVSSRSAAKAERFVQTLNDARFQGVALEHGETFASTLHRIKPFAVIDCSGPFQTADYTSACSILQAGAHLIDIADARGYLAGFSGALGVEAAKHKVVALTGASSTPTLSSCVVDHLTYGWQQVDSIDICITPGGKSEVGRAVIEAIMSYAGQDVPIWRDGAIAKTTGWGGGRRVEIPQLGHRRVAAVETYDAEYLGPRYNVASRVSFAAGLESQVEQRGIELIAALRKRGLCPHPSFLIPMLLQARRITRIPTSDQGGMMVTCAGSDVLGHPVQTNWTLIAKKDHGPYIPILPAAAALQKLLQTDVVLGASLAHTQITLSDILAQMAPYAITTQTEVT